MILFNIFTLLFIMIGLGLVIVDSKRKEDQLGHLVIILASVWLAGMIIYVTVELDQCKNPTKMKPEKITEYLLND